MPRSPVPASAACCCSVQGSASRGGEAGPPARVQRRGGRRCSGRGR